MLLRGLPVRTSCESEAHACCRCIAELLACARIRNAWSWTAAGDVLAGIVMSSACGEGRLARWCAGGTWRWGWCA